MTSVGLEKPVERQRAPAAPPPQKSGQNRLLLAVLALLAAVYLPVFVEASKLWFEDEYSAHCIFIPFLSALLVWWKREELAKAKRESVGWGYPLLVFGLALETLSWYAKFRSVAVFSLLPTLLGVSLLLGGWRITRILLFPILFLFFATPLPRTLVNSVSITVQSLSARGACRLAAELGVPMAQEGFSVKLPNVTVEVAQSCSGFKKMLTLTVMSCFYVSLFAIPFWRQALLVALALPIAMCANIVRVTLLILAGNAWGSAGVHFFHDSSDLFVLALCFALMLWIGKVFGCKKMRYLL